MSNPFGVETPLSPLLVPNLDFAGSLPDSIASALYTLFLFTYTDFKTIVFPVVSHTLSAVPLTALTVQYERQHSLVWRHRYII